MLPSLSSHTATLIFCHGLGDSAEGGWSQVAARFQAKLPGLKVILPNAPVRPVTINGGMKMPSWYDIKAFNTESLPEEPVGLQESRGILEALVREEIHGGIPSTRIILGGFSQGSSLSLFTGLQCAEPLGGIVGMSGRSLFQGDFSKLIAPANKDTPLLMAHGEADQVVRFSIGQSSFQAITEARGSSDHLQFKSYKGVGHSSSDEMIKDVTEWMQKVLG